MLGLGWYDETVLGDCLLVGIGVGVVPTKPCISITPLSAITLLTILPQPLLE